MIRKFYYGVVGTPHNTHTAHYTTIEKHILG